MTHEYGLRTLLDRYLKPHGEPPNADVAAAVERVWRRMQPDMLRAPARLSVRSAPVRRPVRLLAAVAAAAILIVVVSSSYWPGADSLGRVEAADGSLYSLAGDTRRSLRQGDSIGPNEMLRSNGGAGAMLALADGSRVEMRAQSELSLERADDGLRIRLGTGGIIVNAARQRGGHLYVQTKDMTVDVIGTTFVVNAAEDGSRVAVIEGEVRVREGRTETTLRPGEQVSTNPALRARPVAEEIAWSRQADALGAILATFTRGMALTAGPLAPLTNATGSGTAAFGRGGGAAAQGQPAPSRPQFEEASIRTCDPNNIPAPPAGARGGGANSVQMTPGRLNALCMTVATLIRTAYGYGPMELDFNRGGRSIPMDVGQVYGLGEEDGRRVRGGPDWVRSERYTIEAVTGAGAAPNAEAMGGPMLQRLLERRLQLQAHIEAEQVPAYALTVARGGLKIKPVASGACEPLQARPGSGLQFGHPTSVLTAPRPPDDVRRGGKPSCGSWGRRVGQNMVFVAGDVPIEALVQMLAFRLGGVRVLDKTGVADRFNFFLEFAIDENTPGLPGIEQPPPPSDGPRAATVLAALEEQLGLKLEQTRAPREFIVIDRVERPSAN